MNEIDLEKTLEEERQKFDLKKFFLGKGASLGAVCLITDSDMIMTDTFIRSDFDPSYGDHYATLTVMYESLFGRKPGRAYMDEDGEFVCWQEQVVDDGNIVIQLCYDVPSAVWIPENISNEQMKRLKDLSLRIKDISTGEYFKTNPILFEIAYKGKQYFVSDLAEFASNLDNKSIGMKR